MSGLHQLNPAPALRSWSFSGVKEQVSTQPPLPSQPVVVQVGLCAAAADSNQKLDTLIRTGSSGHYILPQMQDWAWSQGRFTQPVLPGSPNGRTPAASQLLQPDAAPLSPRWQQASQGAAASAVEVTDDAVLDDRPGSRGLQAANQQLQLQMRPTSSCSSAGKQQHRDSSKYADLLTAILPSTEDGKLHALISQLRAALCETEAALLHTNAQVR